MLDNLTQQQVDIYASNATAIDKPQGTNYTQGVKVGRTIPAKWWNWLFNAVTTALHKQYTDSVNILSELKNVVTSAGLTPSASNTTQLLQATNILSEQAITNYITNQKRQLFFNWSSAQCTGINSAAYTELLYVKPIRNSNGAYCAAFFHRYSTGDSHTAYYTSSDLLNWKRWFTSAHAELPADFCMYKGRYYGLLPSNSTETTMLYAANSTEDTPTYVRTFQERGTAVGLRVVNDVMWLISASTAVYANVKYHSYYTTNGTNWSDEGAVFKNTELVDDIVGEVVEFKGAYFLGNMRTTDGITWSLNIAGKPNVASARLFVTANTLVTQFYDAEGGWTVQANVSSGYGAKTGSVIIKTQFKSMNGLGDIVALNTDTGKMAVASSGYSFSDSQLDFPSEPDAEFFQIDNYKFAGNYRTTGTLSGWQPVTLPEGAALLHYSGVGCCIIAGNYFSGDKGATWNQGMCLGEPFCAVPDKVTEDITCIAVILIGNRVYRRLTFNGINRVIGTTLYLK